MNNTSVSRGIPSYVNEAREKWAAGREDFREKHNAGATGKEVVTGLSGLLDDVLNDLFSAAAESLGPDLNSRVAMVLHGGNGRGEVAPFSDVDLMLLYHGSLTDDVVELSRRISQNITDAGLRPGYSLRNTRDACGMATKDPETFTSLTASRFLVGNHELFLAFESKFKRLATRRSPYVIRGIINARSQERIKFGETVYLLRPNVKKSRGGLRDIHLIRWLGFVRYGVSDIAEICDRSHLTNADRDQILASNEFLLHLRNEMHFHAGRANDQMGRNEQVRVAEKFGYEETGAMLAVEAFMQEYFRYTSRLRYVCDYFSRISSNRRTISSQVLAPLVTRSLDDNFRIGPEAIGMSKAMLEKYKGDLHEVLRLMQLCGLHERIIEQDTWTGIRQTMLESDDIGFDERSARRFMALLSNTTRLPVMLRRLHEMQVLQKIIPAFKHARGLLQFNEYHSYTVDIHSLKAVSEAVALENEPTVVGKTYTGLRRKNVLHLALLLHDLGKGFAEDHSEVGARIAMETAYRFGLSDEDAADVVFLVHKHLVMSDIAFRRDINDSAMVAQFASKVGSVERLSMLFVLTCADIAAVGPGVLNDWKLGLLTGLYLHAKKILTGDAENAPEGSRHQLLSIEIAAHGQSTEEQEWLRKHAANLPGNYFNIRPPDVIANELKQLIGIGPDQMRCWVHRIPDSRMIDLVIAKHKRRRSGNFYRLTGMLTALGYTIFSCDIKSLDDDIIWMWYGLHDNNFVDPPPSRIEQTIEKTRKLIKDGGGEWEPPVFRKSWRETESRALQLSRPEIGVEINNQSVDTATIIDVFAYNKTGLLYTIAEKIYRLGLDVSYVKVATYAHQVVDVFYVTDEHGNKLRNREQIHNIKNEILTVVESYLEPQGSE
ncbi:MAG: HD domain-containing protein [Planctomycetota bacterium]